MYKKLQKNIQFLSKRSALYVNKKKDRESTLKKRDKVYLLRQNIKIKQKSNKLNYTKLRLFAILEVKESINYKLNFSIFYILLLKFADSATSVQINLLDINSENQIKKYKVGEILDQLNI